MPSRDSPAFERSQSTYHLDDLERRIGRERPTIPGLPKARLAVQGEGGGAVGRSPQTKTAQPALSRPGEHFLEQSTSNAAPSPRWFHPHATDPAHFAPFPIKEPIRGAAHVFVLKREEHHVPTGLGDGARQVLPVGRRPGRRLRERLAKRIWRIPQGLQTHLAMETHLVWDQSPYLHEAAGQSAQRHCSAAGR